MAKSKARRARPRRCAGRPGDESAAISSSQWKWGVRATLTTAKAVTGARTSTTHPSWAPRRSTPPSSSPPHRQVSSSVRREVDES